MGSDDQDDDDLAERSTSHGYFDPPDPAPGPRRLQKMGAFICELEERPSPSASLEIKFEEKKEGDEEKGQSSENPDLRNGSGSGKEE
jgi:hypothetical protein